MNYVIIGNSAAAVGTIAGIREFDSTGNITVISDEKYHTYSRPLISYWLEGKVTDKNILYRDADFYEKNNVTPVLGRKVVMTFDGKDKPHEEEKHDPVSDFLAKAEKAGVKIKYKQSKC